MKKLNQTLLTLILVLALIGTAYATVGQKTATLDYTDIKITLNGNEIVPKDANGNAVEPFAISGTTYLPVRAVANAFGLDVSWDQETKTVGLKSKTVAVSIPESEKLIFDEGGIQVYYRDVVESTSFLKGVEVKLRIVNNSDQDIMVQARDESVNGIMVDGALSVDVVQGKTALDSLHFWQSDLDSAEINAVEEIEFKLHIAKAETWATLYDSDIISIK